MDHSIKAALRADVRKTRRSGSLASASAQKQLASATARLIAGRPAVVAYAALPGEPNLDSALNAHMHDGGTVFLPVTRPNRPLTWGRAPGRMDLPPRGKWHIREPREELTTPQLAEHLLDLTPHASLHSKENRAGTSETSGPERAALPQDRPHAPLVLVPGLRFGADGTRLGNGGGFYDRTFGPQGQAAALAHEVPLTGVCFSWEFGGRLAAEEWDLTVQSVLTEDGLRTAE